MGELVAVVIITVLAVISPGADFAIVTRNSYLFGKRMGVITSFGIALGVLVHVAYTLFSLAFIMSYTPQILNVIKYIGAIYLVYIGYKTYRQRPIIDSQTISHENTWQALKYGFLTNALNPKTTLFVISTYTQVVSIGTAKPILLAYGLWMSFAHLAWFTLVSIMFSSMFLRQKLLTRQVLINRVIGLVLCLLGLVLLLTKLD